MRIQIGSYVLCDGSSASPTGLAVSEKRQTQIVQGLRWSQVKALDRINKQTTVSFEIIRGFDTLGQAEKFMMIHGSQVPDNGLATFTAFDGSSTFLAATQIENIAGKQTGATTFHTYQMVGGAVTQTKPK
jgi:hypothetical protein